MRVADYVDRAFDDVVTAFGTPRIDGALCSAMRAGLGLRDESVIVQVHASEPQLVAAGSARLSVSWSYSDRPGSDHEGTASLQLLLTQSGNEPVTELLVTVTVDEDRATGVATVAHRLLDDLTRYLAALPV